MFRENPGIKKPETGPGFKRIRGRAVILLLSPVLRKL